MARRGVGAAASRTLPQTSSCGFVVSVVRKYSSVLSLRSDIAHLVATTLAVVVASSRKKFVPG